MRTLLVSGILLLFIIVQCGREPKPDRQLMVMVVAIMLYLTTVFAIKLQILNLCMTTKNTSQHGLYGHYFHEYKGKTVNKYYAGTALMMLPFYTMASILSKLANMPVDGYNILFQYAVALAAAFYLAIGLLLVNALLKTFTISKPIRLLTLLSLLLGTNLFYYAFLHPAHSHVYSFAAIAGFAYYARVFMLHGKAKALYKMSLLLGLVALIRPTNLLLVLLIPFLQLILKR